MKRFCCAILVCILLTTLCACGGEEEPTVTPSVQPTTTVPEVSIEPQKELSPTTGLEGSEKYMPIAVMIENSEAARPQAGIQAADIVYEALAEGSITRFMCIFNDNYPERVGPVRSARIYFIKMQQEWDSMFVHYGGPDDSGKESYIYGKAADHIQNRINGIQGKWTSYFWRDNSRKAPHNVYTNLVKDAEVFDYQPEVREMQFDAQKEYSGQTVKKISLPYLGGEDFVNYTYDAQKDVFLRAMGSKAFTDQTTGSQVEVKNIIVQYVDYYVIKNDSSGRRNAKLTGSGDAEFFIGGKHIKGTWERESYDSPTIYRDEDGQEIVLRPGNTWIQMHPEEKEISVEYQ